MDDTPTGAAPGARPGRLLELGVADLALIDRLRLAFDGGLNVLTGETGAGKSLLIDALGLVRGARADTSLVRHGAEIARVEALFDGVPEGPIAVREISANGRSIARLDDAIVTAARLAEAIGPLVEIHGQHDQQQLLDDRHQRDLLDGYGGHHAARAAMAAAVVRWAENRSALQALAMDPRELVRRLELLEHEAGEIAAARLRPGEAEEIHGRLAAARHGEAIARGADAIREGLFGDGRSARDAVARAAREAEAIARLDPRWTTVADRLGAVVAELGDIADDTRGLAEDTEHDPAALAALEERLSLIFGLERRFGEDEAAVIAHGAAAETEAVRLRGLEDERHQRAEDDAGLLAAVAGAAAVLGDLRRGAAERLAREVDTVLGALGFPGGAFGVSVGRRPAGREEAAIELDGDAVAFDASGADDVVFTFRPNPGEPARPLARIASGGELSRVALAVMQVLAEVDATPTLVFDEIDAGIGGRSAEPVGACLRALAARHQVLVVTHLPQIAAHADAHFRIAKHARDGRTVTEVVRLDREGRIVELAAMLGGAEDGVPGTAALASARELLDRAEARRGEPLAPG